MDGDLADPVAVAVDAKPAPLTGDGKVGGIEANGLGDAGTGVERDAGQGTVARRRAGLHRAQPSQLCGPVERPGGRGGNGGSLGGGPAHAAAGVEVVDGGQGVVDGGRGLVGDGEQVGAPVADRPVPGGGVGEGVTVDSGGG